MNVLLIIRENLFRERLIDLGVRFAAAKDKELYVVEQSPETELPDIKNLKWKGKDIKSVNLSTTNLFRTISDLVAELKPEMLMLNEALDHSEQHTRVINQAINEISCEVMIVRLGDGDHHGEKILVPCGGGIHSRVALSMAHKMAGKNATAFFVEPDVDEVSESVGFAQLHRQITRAKVPADEVRCEVVLDSNVFDGIKVIRVQKSTHLDGLPLIELTLESSQPVEDKIIRRLKRAVEKAMGEEIHLRVRTVLVKEL